jgi:hypothetical protein
MNRSVLLYLEETEISTTVTPTSTVLNRFIKSYKDFFKYAKEKGIRYPTPIEPPKRTPVKND